MFVCYENLERAFWNRKKGSTFSLFGNSAFKGVKKGIHGFPRGFYNFLQNNPKKLKLLPNVTWGIPKKKHFWIFSKFGKEGMEIGNFVSYPSEDEINFSLNKLKSVRQLKNHEIFWMTFNIQYICYPLSLWSPPAKILYLNPFIFHFFTPISSTPF